MKLLPIRPAAGRTRHFNKIILVVATTAITALGETLRRTRRRAAAKQREDDRRTEIENNEKFHQLADNLSDAFWIRSPDMRQLHYVSQAFERIWGRSVDSLKENPDQWIDFVLPEDRAHVLAAFETLEKGAPSMETEYRIVRPEGEIRWICVKGFPVRDANGTVIRHTGMVTDITNRKNAEASLSRASRALKVMSACNEALVRASSELDLTDRACEIAIEIGGYKAAWVDYADSELDVPQLADERDVRLPLRNDHRFLGWLNVRPEDSVNPTDEELKLLQDMTDNLAFGMGTRRAEIERRRIEAAMITVAASVSAATSNVFFEQLVRSMATALGAQGAFVAEFMPEDFGTARTIAAVVDGTLIPAFDYAIPGTPCARLLTADTCVMAERVTEQFPQCERLVALKAQGYVGRRLDNSSGVPVGLLFVVFKDPLKHVEFITSTLQIFAARAASEMERLQTDVQVREQAALLDIAHEAIIVKDMDNRVIYWNGGAERTYGWTAQEAFELDTQDMLHGKPDELLKARAELLEMGKWEGELSGRIKNGSEITVHARWTLVRDARGDPKSILTINNDITEMKKLESKFLRAQRMEGIGTLAGGMAHDLNNVLAPILLATEMLKGSVTDPDDLILLTTVRTSAQRGAELVKQVLSFARGVEGDRTIVNPLDLMGDFLEVVRETFPKSIDIRFTSPKDLWTVTGDATQMNQVFLNLCVNARDAMPDGGKLTIGMGNITLDDDFVSMNPDCRPGAYVVMSFEDSGVGIPMEIRDRIFEPFFTTKEIGKGTGLGLSTTLGIVKSHGGFVDLYSEVDRGTTFKVYFTANSVQTPAKAISHDEGTRPRGDGSLILVVDDEPAIRNVTKRILERFGYQVLLASDGLEAVKLYELNGRDIAAVLTDMSMPVMDGASTILALREINPLVRVIGSSGLAFSGGEDEANSFGLRHFITKPYTAEVMLQTLHDVLDEADEELLDIREIQMTT